ncbi:PEP-CTERM sorting domain-containing protein [Planctomycetota bacterium]|nr:PEP-CTERM sorting domain-containing protein [Planctomycetota bacterium]
MRRHFQFLKHCGFTALAFATCANVYAGDFDPAAGQSGSLAIHMDDTAFVAWATDIELQRGPVDITNASSALANYGSPDMALGKATGSSYDVVSLGDSGSATLTFNKPITNGQGADFAIFENSFSDTFLEFAFVEVSSDGANFFRFDSISQTQTDTQINGFGITDPTNIYNLAGKYKQGFGTSFDLDQLLNNDGLDVNAITHVKVIDVVGSIDEAYGSKDSLGNMINDPFTTPFSSSGFDLDAVGVINQLPEPASALLVFAGITMGLLRRQHN